jgi:lipoprotein-anchoring transpeptidase ErfK/SrfK
MPTPSTPPAPPTPQASAAPEPAPPAGPLPVGTEELQRARDLRAAGQLVAARDLLQPLADLPEAPAELLALLGEINTQILFTPVPAPEKIEHTVVAGDTLGKLATQYNCPIALIKRANHLSSDTIRIGTRLRIYRPDFALVANKTANTLTVTDRGKFFKRYRIGTGEFSKTPVGQFKIVNRQEKPTWYRGDKEIPYGDPENVLGTHWLGLDIPGYGIHGTWDDSVIGKQSTAGCLRLTNQDIAELYSMLPLGTPVTIRE